MEDCFREKADVEPEKVFGTSLSDLNEASRQDNEAVAVKVVASNESEILRAPPSTKAGRLQDLDEKVVVFVGCTQNGKSSLIRSILQYGGYGKEASEVEIGIGNKSTTKEVSSQRVLININCHELKDGEGLPVQFVDENTSMHDLEPSSTPSSQDIRLLMIDTPGLDDSDNSEEDRQRHGGQSHTSDHQMRTVDERHKLAVLQALSKVKNIHAVCFVLSLENTLGNATQDLTREYLRIFEKCNLNASIHFAHTYFNVDNMFSDKTRNRPRVVRETFGLRFGQDTHHYIDNLALEDDPISQHFANLGIARLLLSLQGEVGQSTSCLQYPKSNAHISMDRDLDQSIDILERSWQKEVVNLEEKISRLEASKLPFDAASKVLSESQQKLHDKVNKLNTNSLWPIGDQKLEHSAEITRKRLYFHISTNAIIRSIDVEKRYNAEWESYPSGIGTMHCSAVLKSDWFSSVWGSIKLWGYTKEARAEELKSFQKEGKETLEELKTTNSKINMIDYEIDRIKEEITEIKSKIEDLQSDRRPLQLDYIPIQTIESNASYFCTPNIVSYSLGHNIIRQVPIILLPGSKILAADIIIAGDSEITELSSLVELSAITLEAIRIDALRKKIIKSQLENLVAERSHEEAQIKTRINIAQCWEPKSNILQLEPRDRAEVTEHLQKLLHTFECRATDSQTHETSLLRRELEHLGGNINMLEQKIRELESLIKENSAGRSKWNRLLGNYKASLEGIRMTGTILRTCTEEMGIGPFTILRMGIEEFGEDSREPWQRLSDSLKGLYESGEEKFEEACKILMIVK